MIGFCYCKKKKHTKQKTMKISDGANTRLKDAKRCALFTAYLIDTLNRRMNMLNKTKKESLSDINASSVYTRFDRDVSKNGCSTSECNHFG